MNENKSGAFDLNPDNQGGYPLAGAPNLTGHSLAVERWLARRMLRSLGDPPINIQLWSGEVVEGAAAPHIARIVLTDRAALWKLASDPEYQFGELYSQGRLQVYGDLVALLELSYRGSSSDGTFREHLTSWRYRPHAASLRRAKTNIHHHYDIGNDFYRLWLDDAMVYTCAYFPTETTTLEAAQQAKLEHTCRKLRLRENENVVEAGCGWGSLALYMAQHHGVKVRAFNISHEQIVYARERAKALDLESRVEFVEDDYRNIAGKYDAFVSVGMLEHVGPGNYEALGAVIDRCLGPDGRGLIHSIGRNRPIRMNAWIAERIFPGGYTPALSEMTRIFEPYAFSILDVENLRLHYARTLRHWLERFERSADQIRQMFDDRFVRMWRLYLAGSLAAFSTGWMQLFQVTFNRTMCNDVPLTREHLYCAR